MRITVTRSGGFGGLTRSWSIEISGDEDEWRDLVAHLPWDEVHPAPPQPDRYVYRVRCARREATIPEQQLTGPWRELVDRVREAGDPVG
ncbi:protealysin inhibitor emfourin [Diaminobutyricimonas sp. TR449]|uniref:protealysin inhibitor emfourin n=1 Tax=Diaminobutyricimonas sp. TR449 TaxID=2708076 RepID=UPI001AB01EA1|nr:protealysin inhibitor emfourin [Diaminobutyricimonas sp. TR449]